MEQNGDGFSGFAKGLFVGSLLGTATTFLYAPRSRTGLRNDIPQEDVRFQRRYQPLPTTRVEQAIEKERPAKTSIAWLAIFCCASVVAMIADARMRNNESNPYGHRK